MKKIFLIISVIALFSACKKDFSVWKEYNEEEYKKFEANLGSNSPDITVSECFKTSSGVLVEVIFRGHGRTTNATSFIYCKGWGELVDGTRFETLDGTRYSVVGDLIKGWQEVLSMQDDSGEKILKEKAIFRIYVPYELGYGKEGRKYNTFSIPPYSTLIFDIKIDEIIPNYP